MFGRWLRNWVRQQMEAGAEDFAQQLAGADNDQADEEQAEKLSRFRLRLLEAPPAPVAQAKERRVQKGRA